MQTGGRTFKHLTKNDRLRIEKWQRRGLKPPQIAEKLRVHVSTIYRELKRGEYERLDGATWEMVTAYSPDIAEARYQEHLREKGPDLKIGSLRVFLFCSPCSAPLTSSPFDCPLCWFLPVTRSARSPAGTPGT